jgi:PAS domain S-box-containing protein
MPRFAIAKEVSVMVRRLLVGLLLLNALAGCWVALDLFDSHQNHERQAQVASRNMAQALDQSVTASAEKINLLLFSCTDFLEDRLRTRHALSAQEVGAFFHQQQERIPELAGLRATDANGVVAFGDGVKPGETARWNDRSFFVALKADPVSSMHVSDPLIGKITRRWVVPFSVRYNDADGKFAGVVSATIYVEYLEQLLSRIDTGKFGSVVLRDSKMGLIARYPRIAGPTGMIGSKVVSTELARTIDSGDRMATYRAITASDNVQRISTYRRLSKLPFHLLAGLGEPDYLRDFQRELAVGISQLLAFLLISSLGARMIWRSIQRTAQESERSGALLRGASDGIHVLDAAGNLVEASDSFFEMLGYWRDEGVTLNVRDWDAHYPPARLDEIIQNLLLEGRANLVTRHRRKDGSEFPVEVTVLPISMQGKKLLFASARDITDRKQAELELQQSHDLLNKISDQVPGALFQLQLDAQGRYALPFYSRSSEELFGLHAQSVKSDASALFAAVLDADRAAFIASLQRSARTLEDWVGEFRVELPDQGIRWRLGQARPERHADGSTLWHGFIADATERIESQNQLRELNETLEARVGERTQELEQALQSAEMANRSRGEFLANTSHEIRTPMNSVLGMVYLALKHNTDPRQREYLQRIQHAGVHLMRIIDDILDFSKIDAGKLQLEIAGFDLGQALAHLLHLAEGRAQEKGLDLQLIKEADVPLLILGDALRIEQILLNFVNNAIKFTDQGGIVIRVRSLERTAAHCQISFEVTDSGRGLQVGEMARLFQSFEQGDKSITRQFGGTGLGLAICRQLAHLMEGEVGVDSEPGQGSTFWFRAQFPVVQAVQQAPDRSGDVQQAMQLLRGTCMLVVDDNEFNLDVARGVLEDAGVAVHTAVNGAMALARLQTATFDCVLMDVQMPVMDGYTATRHIRADARLQQALVIAMTANASGSDRALCLQSGMDDVIRKPIEPQTMFLTLARGLQARRQTVRVESRPGLVESPDAADADPAELKPCLDTLLAWDSQALARMVGNNVESQQRLLRKFQTSAAQTVLEMGLFVQAQDWPALAGMGHKLKSAARSVGAMQLSALCEALEQAGKSRQEDECRHLAGRVEHAFEAVQEHLPAPF